MEFLDELDFFPVEAFASLISLGLNDKSFSHNDLISPGPGAD